MKQEVREGVASLIETMWSPLTDAEVEIYMGQSKVKDSVLRRVFAERKRGKLMLEAMNALLASGGYTMADVATFLRRPEGTYSDYALAKEVGYKEYPRKPLTVADVLRPTKVADEEEEDDVFSLALPSPVSTGASYKYTGGRPGSPPADWSALAPSEDLAIQSALRVTDEMVASPHYIRLSTKERSFVEDMNIRLNGGKWLTVRQLQWLDSINKKLQRAT